jgi:predicted RND superfamily exporter protein
MNESSHMNSELAQAPVFVRALVNCIQRGYLIILLLAFALAYVGFDRAKNMRLDTDITSLMPDGIASVENLEKVVEKTGGYSSIMVVVNSPDPDNNIQFLEDLRESVLQWDWVSSAEYAEDIEIFQQHQLLYVDVEDLREVRSRFGDRIEYEKKNLDFKIDDTNVRIRIRGAGIGEPPSIDFSDIQEKYGADTSDSDDPNAARKIFTDETGELAILNILPSGSTTGMGHSRRLLDEVEDKVASFDLPSYHSEMTVKIGGRIRNRVEEFDAVINDLKSSAFWSIGAIFIAMLLFYRRVFALVYIGIPLVVAFLWTFGIVQVVLGSLNLITIFLVIILFGLGIDFGIHNLFRYEEVRRSGGGPSQALLMVCDKTGRASVMAAITTVIAFYALMVSNFKAFYEFGFIAGTGVLLSLISMYLVFPSLMLLAEKVKLYKPKKFKGNLNQNAAEGLVTNRVANKPMAKPFVWVIGTIIVCLISSVGISQVRFEDDFSKLRANLPQLQPVKDDINKVFPLRTDRAVVFIESLEDVAAVLEAVESIRQQSVDVSSIEAVKSIYDLVPDKAEQEARLAEIVLIEEQIEESVRLLEDFNEEDQNKIESLQEFLTYTAIGELTPEELPEALKLVYTGVSDSGGYLVYIYNTKSVAKLADAQEFVDDIREISANGKTFYPATEAMIFVDMLNLMKSEAVTSIGAVLATLFIMLVLVYRQLSKAVLALSPIIVGMIVMFGAMGFMDIKLNIFNMVVLPTVLGIGVDNAIHIYHRYDEEGRNGISKAIRTTGIAAMLSTMTTMFGFAGMLSAGNKGLVSLGLVACIGLFCCLVASLTFFPALIQLMDSRKMLPH